MIDRSILQREGLPGPPAFSVVLRPNRSLARRGFFVLMTLMAVVSFSAGVVFVSIGAWPVMGFFGLDVLLIYLAFRLNYRSGCRHEMIEIMDGRGRVAQIDHNGSRHIWRFEPYWVRVVVEGELATGMRLQLTSHGRHLTVGHFLAHEEKVRLAEILKSAFAPYKSA